jgi:site-specific recombinase XerD
MDYFQPARVPFPKSTLRASIWPRVLYMPLSHYCSHWFVTHLLRAGMSRDFVKELRGDTRGEAIDIYNHIDKKDLRESYLAHIPQLGI